ncbi:hypothetical protein [Natribacillus halophilus]|uniref:YolD-like protein n=1 Tax=Natribacillus halophilus TaxID=549003 RepID=A0A1G8RRE6_9BACI|nr:hypothetical protein [Natribacillus halophilus]SDJ19479.1 hypothetical protein SAMN04488123_1201 [Natribacillus halophilus]
MNEHLPYGHLPWKWTKNTLMKGMDEKLTLTIGFYEDGSITEIKGSLFKLSDADEEIMIKNDAEFYILKYADIRFAAVNGS